ncbi:hypothetical protein PACTADRAFT_48112 [Pachysolen tannophilus NRRL Y-2460]|uniref:Uncharacterized protein n=1 Tax=Pachysolen tannophilus NRRL Y-2460 TaxID=669874 RepID=A0A1E4U2W1_PACTA|nr:hypothetical protein PACTADRAFT_48112 [Pachysolen tannophilus NRRL Y-2460]
MFSKSVWLEARLGSGLFPSTLQTRVFPPKIGILKSWFHSSFIINKSVSASKDIELDSDDLKYEISQKKEIVAYKTAGLNIFNTKKLPANLRKSFEPIYIGPLSNFIATSKRVSIVFGIVGLYLSKLMLDIGIFNETLIYAMAGFSSLPYPLVQYLTSSYVSAIYRIYDKTKPQTLENLITNEMLIFEKINWSGRKSFNNLVKVDDRNFKLLEKENTKFGWCNWQSTDPDNGILRKYYITDDVGGIKMDRIWGIVERNSGVDNGRTFEK